MLWRDIPSGRMVFEYMGDSGSLEMTAWCDMDELHNNPVPEWTELVLNPWLRFRIGTSFVLDYIEYLIEAAIDRQLADEDCLFRLKRSFLKEYPDGLVSTNLMSDFSLADIIEENTAKEDMKRQKEQHQKDYEKWLFFSPGKSDVG